MKVSTHTGRLLTVSDGDSGLEASKVVTVVRHELDPHFGPSEDLSEELESVREVTAEPLRAVTTGHFHVVVATPATQIVGPGNEGGESPKSMLICW